MLTFDDVEKIATVIRKILVACFMVISFRDRKSEKEPGAGYPFALIQFDTGPFGQRFKAARISAGELNSVPLPGFLRCSAWTCTMPMSLQPESEGKPSRHRYTVSFIVLIVFSIRVVPRWSKG